MIRVIVENILLFLLPTVIYVIFALWTKRDASTGPLDDAPLAWLMFAGTILVIVVLIAFGSTSGGKPGQAYEPPSLKDGKVEPGRIR